jgi:hypothetical protein
MPKLTLHDMPRVAQAQMLAALRRVLWLPPGGHGRLPARTSSPGWPKPADQRTTALRQGRMVPRRRERPPPPAQLQHRGEGASRPGTTADYETSPPGILAISHNTHKHCEHAE